MAFQYCKECNYVFETSEPTPKCLVVEHQKADIPSAKYIEWVCTGKPVLKLKKKEQKDEK